MPYFHGLVCIRYVIDPKTGIEVGDKCKLLASVTPGTVLV
jgi:hypothetical protein